MGSEAMNLLSAAKELRNRQTAYMSLRSDNYVPPARLEEAGQKVGEAASTLDEAIEFFERSIQ